MDDQPFDLDKFRLSFPEFADGAIWGEALLERAWQTSGLHLAKGNRLKGDGYFYARELMAAHLLVMGQKAQEAASSGGVSGLVASAAVDKVSVTIATPPATDHWHYWLAGSPYGQALLAYLKRLASGGLYIGGAPPERAAFRKAGGVFTNGKATN